MGFFSGLKKTVFGSDSMEQNATMTPEQLEAIKNLFGTLSGSVDSSGAALEGFTSEGYNPYDEALADEAYAALKGVRGTQRDTDIENFKNTNIGNRFSLASAAGEQKIRDAYAQDIAGIDMQKLAQKIQGNQSAYSNQMSAIAQALGSYASPLSAQAFSNTPTHDPGLADYAGAIAPYAMMYAML